MLGGGGGGVRVSVCGFGPRLAQGTRPSGSGRPGWPLAWYPLQSHRSAQRGLAASPPNRCQTASQHTDAQTAARAKNRWSQVNFQTRITTELTPCDLQPRAERLSLYALQKHAHRHACVTREGRVHLFKSKCAHRCMGGGVVGGLWGGGGLGS